MPTPVERSRFGLELAFNWPREEEPVPDYRAQAAWWESLDPAPPNSVNHEAIRAVMNRWLWHDPQGAADWLERTKRSPEDYGPKVVYELTRKFKLKRQLGPNWDGVSFQLVRNWREAAPEQFASSMESSRVNNRHKPEALEVLDAIEAFLKPATP